MLNYKKAEFNRLSKWLQKELSLRDWKIKFHFNKPIPDEHKEFETTYGVALTNDIDKIAEIFVDFEQCDKDGLGVINIFIHEFVEIFIADCDINTMTVKGYKKSHRIVGVMAKLLEDKYREENK